MPPFSFRIALHTSVSSHFQLRRTATRVSYTSAYASGTLRTRKRRSNSLIRFLSALFKHLSKPSSLKLTNLFPRRLGRPFIDQASGVKGSSRLFSLSGTPDTVHQIPGYAVNRGAVFGSGSHAPGVVGPKDFEPTRRCVELTPMIQRSVESR